MVDISKRVLNRINKYDIKGNLDHTAKIFLSQCAVNHKEVKKHSEGVALLAEDVAKKLGKDYMATFYMGLLHDNGKIVLPPSYFDGHNISVEEYEEVKKHAEIGSEILREIHFFIGSGAGMHHNVYEGGYGLTTKDLPENMHLGTIKKLLDLAMIVSICDFINAFCNRQTKIKDGSDKGAKSLKEMLYKKYPNDKQVVDIALRENNKYII